MKINSYRIDQLEDFADSVVCRNSAHRPVSPNRIASYINNPRADGSMPVLFTMEENDQVVAYRTLLPDHFFKSGTPYPFAWLSGNFVSPEYRRQGISTRLFKVVEEAWAGRLMYTNYAPASKAVYDKTGSFYEFLEKKGARYYMRSSMKELLKERIGSHGILDFLDKSINSLHDGSIRHMEFNVPQGITVSETDLADKRTIQVIEGHLSESIFRRSVKEFGWINEYPWVSAGINEEQEGEYHFSWRAERFMNLMFNLESKDGTLAFLWITIHNDKLSIPYFLCSDKILVIAARQVVLAQMVKHNCSYLSVWHPELGPALKTRSNPFLLSRKMPQRYFAHQNLKDELPEDSRVSDGDGDCVFS